jgi:hypothetical protein
VKEILAFDPGTPTSTAHEESGIMMNIDELWHAIIQTAW